MRLLLRFFAIVLFVTLSISIYADEAPPSRSSAVGMYEPNPAYPFGRANPDAPEELKQFEFMIGDSECVDHIRQSDGTWQEI